MRQVPGRRAHPSWQRVGGGGGAGGGAGRRIGPSTQGSVERHVSGGGVQASSTASTDG